jgi:hypothetical protein
MRVVLEIRSPSVQHTQEADLGSEVLRIGCDLQERCGAGAQQEVIYNLFVLQSQRRQFVRNREDHVRSDI